MRFPLPVAMPYCVAITASTINPMSSNIHIIGLGAAEPAQLNDAALKAIHEADLVIGSARQLQLIEASLCALTDKPRTIELPKLPKLKALIDANNLASVVVLASGDPLFYGIGRWFGKNFAADCLNFYPAISSVQAACHALGWSLQDVDVISLHGRALDKIRSTLQPKQLLAVLTDKHSGPKALAAQCQQAGLTGSTLWVCENMGYAKQRIRSFSVAQLLALDMLDVDPLHITMIASEGHMPALPSVAGIPDTAYETGQAAGKGMITKREVRLTVLSFIQPSHGDIIWDLGAGCGGVTVELARCNDRAQVYALEQDPQRLNYLQDNSRTFGVSANVHPILGRAPAALADLPSPTKVFIGGSDGELSGLLTTVWALLPEHGILVVTAVTDKTRQTLENFCRSTIKADIECSELSIGRGELTESGFEFNNKRPVMVLKLLKKVI